VNFNGTGTVAIRASYNVSSITDNGTGDYTVNFTTALADANYAALALADGGGGIANFEHWGGGATAFSSTYWRGAATADKAYCHVAIFR
jgi:hypothetical protein